MGSYLGRARPCRGQTLTVSTGDLPRSSSTPVHLVSRSFWDNSMDGCLNMADSLSFKDDEALADSQEHPGRYPVEKAQNLPTSICSSMPLCGQHTPVPMLSGSRMSRSSMILNAVSTKGRATLHFVLGQPVLIVWSFLTGYLLTQSRKETWISAHPEGSKIKRKRVRTKKKKDLPILGKGEGFDKQEEDSPVTKRPSDQGKDTDGDSAPSAFRRLIVKGVLSSFIPRPGPLGRDIYSKNSTKSCIKESQITFKSSYKRNAISSSYSSSLAQWPPEKMYTPVTGSVVSGMASGSAAGAAVQPTRGAAPDAAVDATRGTAPDAAVDATRGAASDAAAGGTQGAAPDAAVDATRGAAPDAAAGGTRGAAPDAAAGGTRGAVPDAAVDATRGAAPDAAVDATRGAAPDAAAGGTQGAALDAIAGGTRGAASDAAVDVTRGAAPDAAVDATRGAAPDAAVDATRGAAPDAAVDATRGTAPDAAAGGTRGAAPDAAVDITRGAAPDAAALVTRAPGASSGVAAGTSAHGTRGASACADPSALPLPGPASSQAKVAAKKGNEKDRSSSGNPKKREKKQKKGKQARDAQAKQGDPRKSLPISDIPRPVRCKIPLLLPHRRHIPLILPPAPELCFRVTAEDFELEKKTAMQQINKVLKDDGAKAWWMT